MKSFAKFLIVLVLCAVVARGLFPLPSLEGRNISSVIPASLNTPLGAAILPLAAAQGEKSGVTILRKGNIALAARIQLARAAQTTIDAQYYLWQNDLSGLLLLDALRQAAERGVRVRLLVDDNGTYGLDATLAALNSITGMEVRLFNPFTLRNPRYAAYLFDFVRLNRRMHNKSFTTDGIVTIVGGRNVGDSYFARGSAGHFADFDILAIGKAAMEVSADFDAYWASGSSYPIDLLTGASGDGLETFRAEVAAYDGNPDFAAYEEAITESSVVQDILDGEPGLEWAVTHLVSDDPAKGLGLAESDQLMLSQLGAILGEPESSVDVMSAYFIPGKPGSALFSSLAQQGVRVRVLTNSQDATDVLPVHAGYVKYRQNLLAAGVDLYELKSEQVPRETQDRFGILGSSSSSLHAKTFTIDAKRVFVGSFNFDPRSVFLNTEMGLLIESPTIAAEMNTLFEERIPANAYRVLADADGSMRWIETLPDGVEISHYTEPETTLLGRFFIRLVSWLPIDWML